MGKIITRLLLCMLIAVLFSGCVTAQKQKMAAENVANLQIALALYHVDTGRYPSEQEGLAVLLRAPAPGLSPYITALPLDPWGNPYRYRLVDGYPVVESAGPDAGR